MLHGATGEAYVVEGSGAGIGCTRNEQIKLRDLASINREAFYLAARDISADLCGGGVKGDDGACIDCNVCFGSCGCHIEVMRDLLPDREREMFYLDCGESLCCDAHVILRRREGDNNI